MTNGKMTSSYSEGEAEELIKESEEGLSISGANIILAEKKMKKLETKARDNIKKLSLLL